MLLIDMTEDIDYYLNELKKYDIVFIGLHGGESENGTIQKVLEQMKLFLLDQTVIICPLWIRIYLK